MKTNLSSLAVVASMLLSYTISAQPQVHYVDLTCTNPVSPYTDWSTAATNIQDAVDAAVDGDQILVTNGVYRAGGRTVNGFSLTNRVVIDKAVTVQSANGPIATTIQGNPTVGSNAVRCVYITNNAILSGFTLSNGGTGDANSSDRFREMSGGAVWCESANAIISNSIISGNSAYYSGGGAYSGTLHNCTLSQNSSGGGGGAEGSVLNNCTLNGNTAWSAGGGVEGAQLTGCVLSQNSGGAGGGASVSTLNNCTLVNNSTPTGNNGGGAYNSTLNNCTLAWNSAGGSGGGAYLGTLYNCLLVSNTAAASGGGAAYATLNNCVVVKNTAAGGGGAYNSTLYNSIVYYNTDQSGGPNIFTCNYAYCCTTPISFAWGYIRNFTNAPLFVDLVHGNLRLQSNSPCINSGNNAYVTGTNDLDGNPRIIAGTVDIGAYEFQNPSSVISYAWLQQYGLTNNGSEDYVDTDGDGMNNYQEWIAGTNPTNAASVLKVNFPSRGAPGLTITWQSVTNWTYYLQRSTNLMVQPPFITFASNILALSGITAYTDTTATNSGPYFYRVGVQ
jgi:hypothetical protein